MSNQPTRRLAFYEIGKGAFAEKVQAEFEQAQICARETQSPVTVTVKIIVAPPDKNDVRYSRVGFTVKTALPDYKSIPYTAELRDGIIVSTGEDVADVLQTKLELPEVGLGSRKAAVNG